MTPRSFRRGCHLEGPHQRASYPPALHATHPKALFRSAPALTPGLTTLAPHQGQIFDQGPTGSCEGHRAAQALTVAFVHLGSPLLFVPSPGGIYADARLVGRKRNPDGSLPPLTDEGATTGDVIKALATFGVEPMGPELDGRHSDVSADNVNDEPTLTDIATERESLVVSPYSVETLDQMSYFQVIQAALKAGYPVGLDIVADTIFERWGDGWIPEIAPLSDCNTDDPSAGGHAILLTEMFVSDDGGVVLGGPNSWGDWGAPAGLGVPGADLTPTTGHWRALPSWFTKACFGVTIFQCARVA